MKRIAILGSTGSVGATALEVAERFRDRFRVVALAAGRNVALLAEQVKRWHPELVSVASEQAAAELRARLSPLKVEVLAGSEGTLAAATHPAAQLVVCAMVGALGLRPTYAAIEAGKDIAFANKEVLVAAGQLVVEAVKRRGVRLLPVDSEHNAVFQCLEGRSTAVLKRIILTASGGPFRTWALEKFHSITVEDALKHPTWRMGDKITIDSATMMNKGLEVIEAHWLFGLPAQQISVVVHPQSIVHSMVELIDGSIIAQMAIPDMTIPVAHALAYPERLPLDHLKPLSLLDCGGLTFEAPDPQRFPCLRLAYAALEAGGVMPACLNAANEELVAGFLSGRVKFAAIPHFIEAVMAREPNRAVSCVEDLLEADGRARALARELMAA
jgi:1-deoxy-D-xylulose-5-phosphate reductoisomerase